MKMNNLKPYIPPRVEVVDVEIENSVLASSNFGVGTQNLNEEDVDF
jgi:hypothetical protein